MMMIVCLNLNVMNVEKKIVQVLKKRRKRKQCFCTSNLNLLMMMMMMIGVWTWQFCFFFKNQNTTTIVLVAVVLMMIIYNLYLLDVYCFFWPYHCVCFWKWMSEKIIYLWLFFPIRFINHLEKVAVFFSPFFVISLHHNLQGILWCLWVSCAVLWLYVV